ncbi:MAG TPA: TetR/AcrR family transcriptional regulator [Solirubrobacteraceae bacterium]|nr:TetR/AcrR family transcriptional regulator [Solirubrobacteraceae bacterium]
MPREEADVSRGDVGVQRDKVGAPRDEIGQIQRARIVAGAIEAVAQSGYGELTVAEVIVRAKISRRTFYELFEDREDCFMAAFEEALARARAPVVEAYNSPSLLRSAGSPSRAVGGSSRVVGAPPPGGGRLWRERIGAALGALLAFFDEQPAFARVLVVDTLAGGPAVLERRARVLEGLVRAVDEGRAESRRGRDPGPLAAEGVVGAVLAVLHARLRASAAAGHGQPLSALAGPLMGMIVLPYLGAAAADRERARPVPKAVRAGAEPRRLEANPLRGLNMRLTYRTLRVLRAVAERPGASNRGVADGAGIVDQGQTSKLLARLRDLGLIENAGGGHSSGEPNAWTLTTRGREVVEAIRDRPAVG